MLSVPHEVMHIHIYMYQIVQKAVIPNLGDGLFSLRSVLSHASGPFTCAVHRTTRMPTSIHLALRNQLHSQQAASAQSRSQTLSNEESSHRARDEKCRA